jgi:succinylglutamate desuccinylase
MRNESETRYLKKDINRYFRNKKENNKIEKSKDKYVLVLNRRMGKERINEN